MLSRSQFDLIDVPSSNESLRIGDVNGLKEIVRKCSSSTLSSEKEQTLGSMLTTFQTMLSFQASIQEYSVLLVSFHLQRHMGNFLIQVYGPCICKFVSGIFM